jgi:hypothetical protein
VMAKRKATPDTIPAALSRSLAALTRALLKALPDRRGPATAAQLVRELARERDEWRRRANRACACGVLPAKRYRWIWTRGAFEESKLYATGDKRTLGNARAFVGDPNGEGIRFVAYPRGEVTANPFEFREGFKTRSEAKRAAEKSVTEYDAKRRGKR